MIKLFVLTCVISLTSQAKIVTAEQNILKKAILENDLSKFKATLGKIDKPFIVESSFIGGKDSSDRSELIGEELIDFSTQQKTCRDEFVKLLVEQGAKPAQLRGMSLGSATKQLCPESLKILIPFFDESVSISIAQEIIKNTLAVTSSVASNHATEAQFLNALNCVKIFSDKVKSNCANDDLKNGWCELKNDLASMQSEIKKIADKVEAEIAAEKEMNSPEGIKKQICELQDEINEAQEAISQQKEIGKTSGVQNKEILYQKGSAIVRLKKDITQLKKLYKEKAKKSFNFLCN